MVETSHTQVQEAQTIQTKENPNRLTPRYTIIKMTNVKDKEKTLKEARKRKSSIRNPIMLSVDFFCRNCAGQKGMALKVLKR